MKTVYVAMCADIFHPGHMNIVKEAKKLGRVIIGVLTDEAILQYKSPPFLPYRIRRIFVETLAEVYKVIPQKTLSYEVNLRKYTPDYVVHGDDWKQGVQQSERMKVIKILSEWGGKLVEVPYTVGISSTKLRAIIKKYYENN